MTEGNCGTVMSGKLSIRLFLLSFFTTRPCCSFANIAWLLLLFHCCSAWNYHDFSFSDLTSSTLIFCPSMVSKASHCTQMEGKRESWRGEEEVFTSVFLVWTDTISWDTCQGFCPQQSDSTMALPVCSCRFNNHNSNTFQVTPPVLQKCRPRAYVF